jgi:hypothetical protein
MQTSLWTGGQHGKSCCLLYLTPRCSKIPRSAHTAVFTCFVWISEQTAIISLYNINWLAFITEESVNCAVRTGSLNIIPVSPGHRPSLAKLSYADQATADNKQRPNWRTKRAKLLINCNWSYNKCLYMYGIFKQSVTLPMEQWISLYNSLHDLTDSEYLCTTVCTTLQTVNISVQQSARPYRQWISLYNSLHDLTDSEYLCTTVRTTLQTVNISV